MAVRKKLGEILVEQGAATAEHVKRALGHQRQWGGKTGRILVDMKLVSEDQLARALAAQSRMPLAKMKADIAPSVAALVPAELAEKHEAIAFGMRTVEKVETVYVAIADPYNMAGMDEIRFHMGKQVKFALAPADEIKRAIARAFSPGEPLEAELPAVEIPSEPVPTPPQPARVSGDPLADLLGASPVAAKPADPLADFFAPPRPAAPAPASDLDDLLGLRETPKPSASSALDDLFDSPSPARQPPVPPAVANPVPVFLYDQATPPRAQPPALVPSFAVGGSAPQRFAPAPISGGMGATELIDHASPADALASMTTDYPSVSGELALEHESPAEALAAFATASSPVAVDVSEDAPLELETGADAAAALTMGLVAQPAADVAPDAPVLELSEEDAVPGIELSEAEIAPIEGEVIHGIAAEAPLESEAEGVEGARSVEGFTGIGSPGELSPGGLPAGLELGEPDQLAFGSEIELGELHGESAQLPADTGGDEAGELGVGKDPSPAAEAPRALAFDIPQVSVAGENLDIGLTAESLFAAEGGGQASIDPALQPGFDGFAGTASQPFDAAAVAAPSEEALEVSIDDEELPSAASAPEPSGEKSGEATTEGDFEAEVSIEEDLDAPAPANPEPSIMVSPELLGAPVALAQDPASDGEALEITEIEEMEVAPEADPETSSDAEELPVAIEDLGEAALGPPSIPATASDEIAGASDDAIEMAIEPSFEMPEALGLEAISSGSLEASRIAPLVPGQEEGALSEVGSSEAGAIGSVAAEPTASQPTPAPEAAPAFMTEAAAADAEAPEEAASLVPGQAPEAMALPEVPGWPGIESAGSALADPAPAGALDGMNLGEVAPEPAAAPECAVEAYSDAAGAPAILGSAEVAPGLTIEGLGETSAAGADELAAASADDISPELAIEARADAPADAPAILGPAEMAPGLTIEALGDASAASADELAAATPEGVSPELAIEALGDGAMAPGVEEPVRSLEVEPEPASGAPADESLAPAAGLAELSGMPPVTEAAEPAAFAADPLAVEDPGPAMDFGEAAVADTGIDQAGATGDLELGAGSRAELSIESRVEGAETAPDGTGDVALWGAPEIGVSSEPMGEAPVGEASPAVEAGFPETMPGTSVEARPELMSDPSAIPGFWAAPGATDEIQAFEPAPDAAAPVAASTFELDGAAQQEPVSVEEAWNVPATDPLAAPESAETSSWDELQGLGEENEAIQAAPAAEVLPESATLEPSPPGEAEVGALGNSDQAPDLGAASIDVSSEPRPPELEPCLTATANEPQWDAVLAQAEESAAVADPSDLEGLDASQPHDAGPQPVAGGLEEGAVAQLEAAPPEAALPPPGAGAEVVTETASAPVSIAANEPAPQPDGAALEQELDFSSVMSELSDEPAAVDGMADVTIGSLPDPATAASPVASLQTPLEPAAEVLSDQPADPGQPSWEQGWASEAEPQAVTDDLDEQIEIPLADGSGGTHSAVIPGPARSASASIDLPGAAEGPAGSNTLEALRSIAQGKQPTGGPAMSSEKLGRAVVKLLLDKGLLAADDLIGMLAISPEKLSASIIKLLLAKGLISPDDLVSMLAIPAERLNATVLVMLVEHGVLEADCVEKALR